MTQAQVIISETLRSLERPRESNEINGDDQENVKASVHIKVVIGCETLT